MAHPWDTPKTYAQSQRKEGSYVVIFIIYAHLHCIHTTTELPANEGSSFAIEQRKSWEGARWKALSWGRQQRVNIRGHFLARHATLFLIGFLPRRKNEENIMGSSEIYVTRRRRWRGGEGWYASLASAHGVPFSWKLYSLCLAQLRVRRPCWCEFMCTYHWFIYLLVTPVRWSFLPGRSVEIRGKWTRV